MNKTIRVLLVEDNLDFREIISLTLGAEKDIELVGQFGTTEGALRDLKSKSAEDMPDLILLDLRLPGMDGLESLPYFRRALPKANIIILTQSEEETDVLRAIAHGASGYLLKSATLTQLTEGIRIVMEGGAALDTYMARFILNYLQGNAPKTEVNNILAPRELEVLQLLSEGQVKKQIADELEISYATVDTYMRRIYDKLEVHNAPSAVRRAANLGLFKEG